MGMRKALFGYSSCCFLFGLAIACSPDGANEQEMAGDGAEALAGESSTPILRNPGECATTFECAQKALDSAEKMRAALQSAVPSGTVIAFNGERCPSGWRAFEAGAGRVLVGTGSGNRDQNDKMLSPRVWQEFGGAEEHELSLKEMPRHSHSVTFSDGHSSPEHTDYSPGEFGRKHGSETSTEAGESAPHNNMPPFYVLNFCERI